MHSYEIEEMMVAIPQGSIALRDDRKKEKWAVEIRAFTLSKFLVTQELYTAVMDHNPATFVGDRKPVETVSWFEAVLFCNQLSGLNGFEPCYLVDLQAESVESVEWVESANGYRLPTDAEWEYACRAGVNAVQYGPIDEIAWYEENSEGNTHDVGLKTENSFGLFDMLGNVWE